MSEYPTRHPISRAKFFLEKAKGCNASQRVDFEAYLEASIIFSRSILHRLQFEYKKKLGWKTWWDSIENNYSVLFFKYERNRILKEGPPIIGQIIRLGEQQGKAENLYYYEDPGTPATITVEKHLLEMERLVEEAHMAFDK